MRRPPAGLADTSVFIARESGRPLGQLPERLSVSVVTVGELELGVLSATDDATRARRTDTLGIVRMAEPLPITEPAMVAWAGLVADCRKAGVHKVVKLTDSLIAATAIERGLPVVTQDDDYELIARAHPRLTVYRV